MYQDLQALKRQIPLLDYLRRHNWRAKRVGKEFVGLCPLHLEARPSFYVNAAKNVFYCHGCGCGGDLIRFVQLSRKLSFCEAILYLNQQLRLSDLGEDEAIREAVDCYGRQLGSHPEALDYLHHRGLHDPRLIEQLAIGYAPGGMLYRHMSQLGFSADLLQRLGLVHLGKDAFYRCITFPCFDGDRPVNLYGRCIRGPVHHRFLARPKGSLFAWSRVRDHSELILVEGLFDLAVLWQAGFINTTSPFGVHLTEMQLSQLSDRSGRMVFIAFDSDPAGQNASQVLAQRLQDAGLSARIVDFPAGEDPNSYFLAGASASEFDRLLDKARSL